MNLLEVQQVARGRRKSSRAKEAVIAWIRLLMRKRDWSGTDLARNAGISPSTILRALNQPDYEYVFSQRTLEKIARGAGEPLPIHLRDHATDVDQSSSDQTKWGWQPPSHPHRLIEVRSVSALPVSSQSKVKVAKAEVIPAPFHLEDDDTAFAFRNPDEVLAPWFRPRALMFATKARDPTGGDLVMLTGKDGRSRVRLLLGVSETGLSLSRSLPAKEDERIGFDDIGDIAVIVEVIMD
ncbi:transcriptional regulator with XRE-family HTH domain [Bradyrhizobium japonicum]|uniref:helix-turn-helix domain-containing protein n=1 Tax=Bradyrhizobium japonicum TaxID=375 RepID=UPI002225BDC8|nr:helix-turn-helix transcriptional regulator [Bradyrhizobium japonicum]MCW2225668.1 transcriptional regulator with XRE-family HTH domain [Bradyrhizobium japonicum]MCW2340880.1 transcriptional regulator with XRE-family HTH domain [Bradyrhizobium japonicum]